MFSYWWQLLTGWLGYLSLNLEPNPLIKLFTLLPDSGAGVDFVSGMDTRFFESILLDSGLFGSETF